MQFIKTEVLLIVLICLNIGESTSRVKKRKLDQFEEEEEDDDRHSDTVGRVQSYCPQNADNISRKEIDSHIRRFVSIFLRVSGLKDKDTQPHHNSDKFNTKIHLTITSGQLQLLQKFSRGEISSVSISELDQMMVKMFFRPTLDEFGDFWSKINIWKWLPNITMPQFLMVAIMLTALYYYYLYGIKHAIIFVLLALTFLDALTKYSKLVKDMQMRRFSQAHGHLSNCNPSSRGCLSLIWGSIFGDDCYAYEQTPDTDEEISFVHCLLQTYLITFMELPFLHFGKALASFTNALSDKFGVFQYVMYPVILTIVIVPVIGMVLNLMGSNFSASTFFGRFSLNAPVTPPNASTSYERTRQVGSSQSAPVVNVVINNSTKRRSSSVAKITGKGLAKLKFSKDQGKKLSALTPQPKMHGNLTKTGIRRIASLPNLQMESLIEHKLKPENDRKISAPVQAIEYRNLGKPLLPVLERSDPEIATKIRAPLVQTVSVNPNDDDESSQHVFVPENESSPSSNSSICSTSDSFEILHEIESMRADLCRERTDDECDK